MISQNDLNTIVPKIELRHVGLSRVHLPEKIKICSLDIKNKKEVWRFRF